MSPHRPFFFNTRTHHFAHSEQTFCSGRILQNQYTKITPSLRLKIQWRQGFASDFTPKSQPPAVSRLSREGKPPFFDPFFTRFSCLFSGEFHARAVQSGWPRVAPPPFVSSTKIKRKNDSDFLPRRADAYLPFEERLGDKHSRSLCF